MGNKNARATKSLGDLRNPGSALPIQQENIPKIKNEAIASPKTLAFKSYRQGTLVTQNFEPVTAKSSKPLSATSPAFVPAVSVKATAFSHSPSNLETPPAVLDLNNSMLSKSQVPATTTKLSTAGAEPLKTTNYHSRPDSTPRKIPTGPSMKIGVSARGYSTNSTPDKSNSDFSIFATPASMSNYTAISTPSPLRVATFPDEHEEKVRYVREDKKKKDIIISQTGITRNLARIIDCYTENGYPYQSTCADEFQPGVYDVAEVVSKMPKQEREEFWAKNWIEIEVDFRTAEERTGMLGMNGKAPEQEKLDSKDYDILLQYIDHLGPEFSANAKCIFVSILFPSFPDGDQHEPNVVSSVRESQQTSEFKHMERLVAKLQDFPAIKRLDVVLQTPSNTKKPLSIPQLNLVLPFYDLGFTEWNIKWKTSFMTKAEPVGGWPIHYLDKERNRLLREREKVKNAVFVRKSQFTAM